MDTKNIVSTAAESIKNGDAALVIIKDGEIIRSMSGRGIKPIITMYDDGVLCGSTVVDKVVGRAAAVVMLLGGVKHCHAMTISRHALDFFEKNDIKVTYDETVEYIINRAGDGMCPMEETVKNIDDADEALSALRAKLRDIEMH